MRADSGRKACYSEADAHNCHVCGVWDIAYPADYCRPDSDKVLPGRRTELLVEIPPMRLPSVMSLLKRSLARTGFFVKEVMPTFIFASVLIFLFHWLGGLDFLEHALRPVLNGVLGLPEKSVQVFIKLIVRRESGAAELQRVHN